MIYAITLVLIFIIKILNPRNKNIYTYLDTKYGKPVVTLYRKFLKVKLKLSKINSDIEFLNTCINYNLYPKFLNFNYQ